MKIIQKNTWYDLEQFINTQKFQESTHLYLPDGNELELYSTLVTRNAIKKQKKILQEETHYFASSNPLEPKNHFLDYINLTPLPDKQSFYQEQKLLQKILKKMTKLKPIKEYFYLDLIYHKSNPYTELNYTTLLNDQDQTYVSDIPLIEDQEQKNIFEVSDWAPISQNIHQTNSIPLIDEFELTFFGNLLIPYDKEILKQIKLKVQTINLYE